MSCSAELSMKKVNNLEPSLQNFEPRHEISNNVVCTTANAQTSLLIRLEYSMNVKLLTEQHLESLSSKGGCTGSSEYTLVKIPHCWKSRVTAQILSMTSVNIQLMHSF